MEGWKLLYVTPHTCMADIPCVVLFRSGASCSKSRFCWSLVTLARLPTNYTLNKTVTLYRTIPGFTSFRKKSLENMVEKRENVGNQHFSFSRHVSALSKTLPVIRATFYLTAANFICRLQQILTSAQFCYLVKFFFRISE